MKRMSLFTWNDLYAVHHPMIDTQHKKLFKYADDLHAAMLKGAARSIIASTLTNLIEYTQSHFSEEEKLMRSSGYPKFQQHKAIHEALTKKVKDLKAAYDSKQVTITVDTMQFLRSWLEDHIMVMDRDIAWYVNEKSAGLVGAGAKK